ncbi:CGNR zinc finger domain-containing protein [Mumia sp. zg.B17]|uniref:CGNR zinc finger domain-containing protein n=1 Tax=Mumia sp. zg.B17 TaxID=2855446 RepID=UPI001C6F19F9|nr:CGNR zinc finger domain-containing protein [Mumia sp. zg.B17]MBW9205212.1 CGNR zinc finger domain-containing protein [Mumia sp. zg.B17]
MTERFAHVSGSSALDALNTVDWRLDPERSSEQLTGIGEVLDWCVEAGMLGPDEVATLRGDARDHPRLAAEAVSAFRAARDSAYGAMVEHDENAIADFQTHQREAFSRACPHPADGGRWTWLDDALTLRTPTHRLVRALTDLAQSDDVLRLHRCEDDVCGWVFLDTSPRRNRRWCAANDCGDRNRARAYYKRKSAQRD